MLRPWLLVVWVVELEAVLGAELVVVLVVVHLVALRELVVDSGWRMVKWGKWENKRWKPLPVDQKVDFVQRTHP